MASRLLSASPHIGDAELTGDELDEMLTEHGMILDDEHAG
jgi:hypothetical protein